MRRFRACQARSMGATPPPPSALRHVVLTISLLCHPRTSVILHGNSFAPVCARGMCCCTRAPPSLVFALSLFFFRLNFWTAEVSHAPPPFRSELIAACRLRKATWRWLCTAAVFHPVPRLAALAAPHTRSSCRLLRRRRKATRLSHIPISLRRKRTSAPNLASFFLLSSSTVGSVGRNL